jgi:hypothetical protein
MKIKNNTYNSLSNIIKELNSICNQVNGTANFLVHTASELSKTEKENVSILAEKGKTGWNKAMPTAVAASAAASLNRDASKKITIGSTTQRGKQDWLKAEPTAKVAAVSGTASSVIGSALSATAPKEAGIIDSAVNKIKTKYGEFKENLPDKIKSEAKFAAVGAVGLAVGTGIKELSKAIGITGGTAEAYAGYSSSGVYNSSSTSGKDWIATSSASLGSINAGASARAVFDPAKGNIFASIGAGFNATGAKVTASVIGRYGSASLAAAAGVVDANVGASASLMKSGSFMPTAAIGAAAKIVALEGSAAVKTGNAYVGAGASATGSVGAVSGSANAEFDMEKGNINAGVNGMVSAAKGSVRGEVDLGLVKGSVSATGYAGAVGVEASVGLKDGKFSADIGAALGVGGKVSFDVDVGSAVKNLDKVTGGAVSGAVGVLNEGIKAAGAAVGTVVNSGKAIVSGIKDFGSSVAKGDISGAAKAVVKTTANVVNAVSSGVVTVAKAVGSGIKTAAKSVGKFFKSIFSW